MCPLLVGTSHLGQPRQWVIKKAKRKACWWDALTLIPPYNFPKRGIRQDHHFYSVVYSVVFLVVFQSFHSVAFQLRRLA